MVVLRLVVVVSLVSGSAEFVGGGEFDGEFGVKSTSLPV